MGYIKYLYITYSLFYLSTGAFCFTKQIKIGLYTETIRGCSGPKDKNNHDLKVGCMRKKKERFCLCDKNRCNSALGLFMQKKDILMWIFIVLFIKVF